MSSRREFAGPTSVSRVRLQTVRHNVHLNAEPIVYARGCINTYRRECLLRWSHLDLIEFDVLLVCIIGLKPEHSTRMLYNVNTYIFLYGAGFAIYMRQHIARRLRITRVTGDTLDVRVCADSVSNVLSMVGQTTEQTEPNHIRNMNTHTRNNTTDDAIATGFRGTQTFCFDATCG